MIASWTRIVKLGVTSILFSSMAEASTPAPVVTISTNYNGYATVGGKLAEVPTGPVGISVTNGNVKSSTITDPQGKWSMVFEIRASSYTVESWSLFNAADHSVKKSLNILDGQGQP